MSSLFATENDCGEDRLEATGGAVRLGGYRGMAWMVCVESLLGGAVTWCGWCLLHNSRKLRPSALPEPITMLQRSYHLTQLSLQSPRIEHSVLGGPPTTLFPTVTYVQAVHIRRLKETQYRNLSAEIQPVTCEKILS